MPPRRTQRSSDGRAVERSSQPTSISQRLRTFLQDFNEEADAELGMRCQAAPAELLDDAAITQIARMLQQDVGVAVRPLEGLRRVTDDSPARAAQLASRCLCGLRWCGSGCCDGCWLVHVAA